MTDPKWAVATERGRYYRDPAGGPDLVSVTNVLGTGVNKSFALVPWGAGLVADAVIADPIATARRARTEPTALRRELAAVPRHNSERAANLGTRVHNRAQALVLGVPFPADPEVEPFARQLARWFRLWRVDLVEDVVATETTVLHRQLGYAGTGDLWVWLRTGLQRRRQLWLVDYKTSRHKPADTVYEEQPLQLTALRRAPEWLLPDDTTEPAPRVHRTALLNLRPRSHRFIEVPSGPAQFRAFRGALATTQYVHNAPSGYPAVIPPWAPGAPERTAA